MAKGQEFSADRMCDYFIHLLSNGYNNRRHVLRVSSWVGLIVLGIQRATGVQWRIPRQKQLAFEYAGRMVKARYSHRIKSRGGIEIVEVEPARGLPDKKKILEIRSLEEAERFYNTAPVLFQDAIKD